MIPGQVCGQLPTIINEKINSKLGALPQTVALQQMISLFGGALGLGGGGGGTVCSFSDFRTYFGKCFKT